MRNVPLPSLQNYPRVASLFSDVAREKYFRAHQHAPDFIFAILCQEGDECDGYRGELEDLLAFGDGIGLLDQQTAGRLASMQAEGFFSAFAELEVAAFLTKLGLDLTPSPAGRGDHVGDVQIETTPPVFVEVKAALDRNEELTEGRVISGLIRYAEPLLDQFDDPVIVEFQVLDGGQFARRNLEHWLRTVFSQREDDEQTGTAATHVYESTQGLRLSMKLHPVEGLESPAMLPMSDKTNPPVADYLSASIQSAYDQLPDDGRVSLIILRPFLSLWATEKHVREALFGRVVWDVNLASKDVTERHGGDGLLGPGKWTRLSAVGLLDVRRSIGEKTTRLMIHHNPWAQIPLDASSINRANVHHLLPRDGKMTWEPPLSVSP